VIRKKRTLIKADYEAKCKFIVRNILATACRMNFDNTNIQ
jgi:hypothetical protein